MLMSLWLGLALAQDAPPEPEDPPEPVAAERPLAIPQQAPRPPPDPPPADPVLDAEKLGALRQYRNQHLAVRQYSGQAMGMTTVHTDWYGGYGWGWGTIHSGVPYYYRVDGWGVYQGPQRLDTLTYLDRVGALNEKQIVKQKARTNRMIGGALYGLGAVGIGGSIAASAGVGGAQTRAEYNQWRALSTASVAVILGGFVGGSFPMSQARRLLVHPGHTVDLSLIEEQVADFNESLRIKLDVTPAEALSMENRDIR